MTMSLYPMTQCQLKLRHSVTSRSLAQTLHYIEVALGNIPDWRILDQLTPKLLERKIIEYMYIVAMKIL